MLNSQYNHQYTNISSNTEYQLPNNARTNISFPYGNISSPEQNILFLFFKILEENTPAILNYLLIPELSLLRRTCKRIKIIIEQYYPLRLKIQYDDIKNFERKNKSKMDEFLKIYDLQIPISNNNWFYYDLETAIDTILRLDRKTIAQLRGIKKLTTLNEKIYAPFCIIFNFNSKNEQVMKNGWKKVADNIMSDSKLFINIANLKYENFDDEDILNMFAHLNENEDNIDKIKRFSFSLYEMNNWCKAVVIYHILVHPYKYRNIQNSIQVGSELFKYITFMDEIIDKFYKFKGILEIKKLIKPNLGEYIFTFNYKSNDSMLQTEPDINGLLDDIKNEYIISNILTYLPLRESFIFINVSKFGFNCFKKSLNIMCYYILEQLFIFKYNTFESLYSLIPTIFENNIFSNYFSMLEDIIYPSNYYKEVKLNTLLFLSKDNINDINNYKGKNELINSICKIFCCLFNVKVEKQFDKDYNLINLYIKSVILLSVKGALTKLMKYLNIYNLNNHQIKIIYEELSNIYSVEKIKKVKNINKGFYQLLLWEIYIFEYIKQFNPFLFIDKNVFLNNQLLEEEQINIVNSYIDMMDQLKYLLNVKYHFDQLFFPKNKNTSYNFTSIISNIIKNIKENPNYEHIEFIIDTYNAKQSNISKAYFHCKNLIENRNKHSLYRKIMEQLILINVEMVEGENNNKINNNEKYDENFYIKSFLEINQFNYNNKSENKFKFKENYSSKYFSPNNNKLRNKKNNMNNINNINNINNLKKSNYDISPENFTFKNSYYPKNAKNGHNNIINLYTPQNKVILSEKYFPNENIEINNLYNTNKSYTIKKNRNFNLENHSNNIIYYIPEELIITKILFYLSIEDFPELSLVNKYFYEAIKTHIYIRLFFLEKKKNNIENKYNEIITRITNKRNEFFKENNVSPPNLQHACFLLSHFNKNDIYELKSLFRNYKKEYEIIISVLCIFLNIRPRVYIDNFGQKIIDFFSKGKNLIFNKDFIKIIQNMDLDSLNYDTFTKIEKIMQNEVFSLDKISYYSPSLIHLINLEMGVMEYFRAIRKYCLNFYDYYILDDEEIRFCQKMDEVLNIYYKIKNYTFNKCQEYHEKSINLLKSIDLEQNIDGEIQDFEYNALDKEYNKKMIVENINNVFISNNNNNNSNINDKNNINDEKSIKNEESGDDNNINNNINENNNIK